jgi:hypothetical protein
MHKQVEKYLYAFGVLNQQSGDILHLCQQLLGEARVCNGYLA